MGLQMLVVRLWWTAVPLCGPYVALCFCLAGCGEVAWWLWGGWYCLGCCTHLHWWLGGTWILRRWLRLLCLGLWAVILALSGYAGFSFVLSGCIGGLCCSLYVGTWLHGNCAVPYFHGVRHQSGGRRLRHRPPVQQRLLRGSIHGWGPGLTRKRCLGWRRLANSLLRDCAAFGARLVGRRRLGWARSRRRCLRLRRCRAVQWLLRQPLLFRPRCPGARLREAGLGGWFGVLGGSKGAALMRGRTRQPGKVLSREFKTRRGVQEWERTRRPAKGIKTQLKRLRPSSFTGPSGPSACRFASLRPRRCHGFGGTRGRDGGGPRNLGSGGCHFGGPLVGWLVWLLVSYIGGQLAGHGYEAGIASCNNLSFYNFDNFVLNDVPGRVTQDIFVSKLSFDGGRDTAIFVQSALVSALGSASHECRHDMWVGMRIGEAKNPGPAAGGMLQGLRDFLEKCEPDPGDEAETWLYAELQALLSRRPKNLLQELKSLVTQATRAPIHWRRPQTNQAWEPWTDQGYAAHTWHDSSWQEPWQEPPATQEVDHAAGPWTSSTRWVTTSRRPWADVVDEPEESWPALPTQPDGILTDNAAGSKKRRRNRRDAGTATDAQTGDSASSSDSWSIDRKLWTARSALGFVTNAAELSAELDVSDGVAWVAHVGSLDEAAELWDLFQADRDDDHANDLTLLFPCPNAQVALPSWAEGAVSTLVPGHENGRLGTRRLWMLTAGTAPPSLTSRGAEPLVIKKPPPSLQALRASTFVVRVTFDQAFEPGAWDRVASRPGQQVRLWAGSHGVKQLSIVDAWGFARVGDTKVSGLVRVRDKATAASLWSKSGIRGGGQTWFVDIVGDRSNVLSGDFGVKWVPWLSDEDYMTYLRRVAANAQYGLVLGRGLGVRMLKSDPDFVQAPTLWRAKFIPGHFQLSDVTELMSQLGFQDVAVDTMDRAGKFNHWCFRGRREDNLQVVQRQIQWGSEEDVREIVVLREAARRGHKQQTITPIRAQKHISFGELAVDAKVTARSSKPRSGAKGRTAEPRVGHGETSAVVVAEKAPPRGAKRDGPGEEPGRNMKVDAEGTAGDSSKAWAPLAATLTNVGEGNCLYRALAQCDLGGASRTHRQIRRYAHGCLQKHAEVLQPMWIAAGSHNCSGRPANISWDGFVEEASSNSSWGGCLELLAICLDLKYRAWVYTSTGELHSLNAEGTAGFIALRFDVTKEHWEAFDNIDEAHLRERYVALGGKVFSYADNPCRGGGALTDCASRSSRSSAKSRAPGTGRHFPSLSECASASSRKAAAVRSSRSDGKAMALGSGAPFPSLSECASSSGDIGVHQFPSLSECASGQSTKSTKAGPKAKSHWYAPSDAEIRSLRDAAGSAGKRKRHAPVSSGASDSCLACVDGADLAQELDGQPGQQGAQPKINLVDWYKRGSSMHPARQADGTFKERCAHCPHVFVATSTNNLAKRRYDHYVKWHPGQKRRCGRPVLPVIALSKLAKGLRADWRCPLCSWGIPYGGRAGFSANAFTNTREQHRLDAHPDLSKSDFAKKCRVPACTAGGHVMRGRVSVLNRQPGRRKVKGDALELEGFRGFTWPRLGIHRNKSRLRFSSAWRCKKCTQSFLFVKLARGHKCGPANKNTVKRRVAQVRKVWQKCKGKPREHGVDDETLRTVVDSAVHMLGGHPLHS